MCNLTNCFLCFRLSICERTCVPALVIVLATFAWPIVSVAYLLLVDDFMKQLFERIL